MTLENRDLEAAIRSILAEILPSAVDVKKLALQDSLRASGLDSMRTMELINAIELRFEVHVQDDDLRDESFATVAELIRLLRKLRA